MLHKAVNQRLTTTCGADAPGTALQAQVLEAEGLDHLLSNVDGVVHVAELGTWRQVLRVLNCIAPRCCFRELDAGWYLQVGAGNSTG